MRKIFGLVAAALLAVGLSGNAEAATLNGGTLHDGDSGTFSNLAVKAGSFSDEYAFEGQATPQTLTGSFDDDLEVHTLPRVPNSWPEEPPCRPPAEDAPPE